MNKCLKSGEIQAEARKNRLSGLKRVTCPRKIAGNWIQNGRRGKKIDVRTGKNGSEPSKNRPKSDPKRGKTRKKWALQGKKRVRFLEKCRKLSLKGGKAGKTEILERKRWGGGGAKKTGFTADFAML